MNVAFYLGSAVAIIATAAVITNRNAIHALLYLILSLFAVAVIFVTLGAPFVAALEVIVYAGAIMVLFVFVVMLFNVTPLSVKLEDEWLQPSNWLGPVALGIVLLIGLGAAILGRATPNAGKVIEPTAVGIALYGPYLIGVELSSILLLAGVIGAFHLGHRTDQKQASTGEKANGDQGMTKEDESSLVGALSATKNPTTLLSARE